MSLSITFLAILLICTGCENSSPLPPAATTAPAPPPLATIAPPPPQPVAVPEPAPQPETETVKAEVGVGKRGRSLDEYEGVVVTPVKSLFAFKERSVFEITIPHAINLFQATEGRLPKSHEEFMEKIVAANQIVLPELPEGHRYKWDPEQGELMVERPARPTK